MTWAAARAELATQLATVSITSPITQTIRRVYQTPPGAVQDTPCFIIFPPGVIVERPFGGLRIDRHRVRIALLLRDADKDRAGELVDAYREALITLVDSHITLNSTVTVISAQEVEEGTSVSYAGMEYPGCITFLTLETKQSVNYAL